MIRSHARRIAALLCAAAAVLYTPGVLAAAPTAVIADEAVPLASFAVRQCTAPGSAVERNGVAAIDYSNASEGYIMAQYTGNNHKVKLQLTGGNGVTYTYNLTPGKGYDAFPLTSGSGRYSVSIFENVSGQSYALALSATINAQIVDPLSPYLYPSQYVDFNANSLAVAKGQELAAGASNDLAVLQNVFNWVTSNITYDYAKASSVQSGYLPVVDDIMRSCTGICFDYTAVIATMLRTQNIPTRLEVGYVTGGTYHAWVSVYTPETGWIDNVIQFDGQNWKLLDPTFVSSGNASPEILSFMNNTANYKKVYVY